MAIWRVKSAEQGRAFLGSCGAGGLCIGLFSTAQATESAARVVSFSAMQIKDYLMSNAMDRNRVWGVVCRRLVIR